MASPQLWLLSSLHGCESKLGPDLTINRLGKNRFNNALQIHRVVMNMLMLRIWAICGQEAVGSIDCMYVCIRTGPVRAPAGRDGCHGDFLRHRGSGGGNWLNLQETETSVKDLKGTMSSLEGTVTIFPRCIARKIILLQSQHSQFCFCNIDYLACNPKFQQQYEHLFQ